MPDTFMLPILGGVVLLIIAGAVLALIGIIAAWKWWTGGLVLWALAFLVIHLLDR